MSRKKLGEDLRKALLDQFEDRVALNALERNLYARDMNTLPKFLSWFLATEPCAVVQPLKKTDLEALTEMAYHYQVPLVPRGAGTASYGGAIPTKGGIVVDFSRMKTILEIDEKNEICAVEPGAVFQEVQQSLRKRNLSLKVYPSSAISATVGGWLANGGGVGIGSFRHGTFPENVAGVELVTPKGVRTLQPEQFALVSGLAGTTGFIVKVRLSIKKADTEIPYLTLLPDLRSLSSIFQHLEDYGRKFYHISYYSASLLRKAREALETQSKRDEVHHDPVDLPSIPAGGVLALFVGQSFPEAYRDLIKKQGGELLDSDTANYVWRERFYPMRIKAVGPSLITSEVILPTPLLPTFLDRVKKKLGSEFFFEGTLMNRGRQTTVLTNVLQDERRKHFIFSYPLSLIPIEEAKKLGGRPYALGMFLTSEAPLVLGKDRLKVIANFRNDVDPKGLMNPGKVFPPSVDRASPLGKMNHLVRLGRIVTPGLLLLHKLFAKNHGDKSPVYPLSRPQAALGKELEWDAYACAGCGYCRTVCTEFNVFSWESASPRGKFRFIRDQIEKGTELDERLADMFFMCATCRRCDKVCQVRTPILARWDLAIRPLLWERGYQLPLYFQGTTESVVTHHNPLGYPHENRMDWADSEISFKDEGELGYWVGCTASYAMKPLAQNPLRILNHAGISPVLFGRDEWCCGCDMMLYGRFDEIMETVRHNIEAIGRRGVKTLATHCPGCWSSFKLYYPILARRMGLEYNLKVLHITELLADLIGCRKIKPEKVLDIRVTYHDSCHIGRRGGIYLAPREVLRALPGVEVVEMPQNMDDAPCCGRQLFAFTDAGPKPYVDRAAEASGTGASALITNCPGCQVAYIVGAKEANLNLEVLDITDLVASSLGLRVTSSKTIARMARQAYAGKIKPKIQKDLNRSRSLFAPVEDTYPLLCRKEGKT